ncbi:class I SAM-dependent methyltransferase [Streptomyces sp. RS10V-4]|uniref:class I SAM-dependent methyltransferase n=1 Tax=Streptomyces rhizoryzae TaxID=2932493 RepID=UPI002002B6FB|nr:class I SAM-dependent methyltransferase [Streptomyces rhizoryzae]MCK7621956.1 class I SAM-dependent methyltransferase [Streptomyces rhizoryzae]
MPQQPPPAGGPGRPDRPGHPDGAARPDLPERVAATYGAEDLGTVPAFAGGFINFGYWAWLPEPADRPLTEDDRIRSEQDLYRLVLDTCDRPRGRTALEVGCGRGLGCALALKEFDFRSVIGLDAHPDQIARALEANAALLSEGAGPRRLEFVLGPAQRMPLPDGCADFVYSVEAAQHFRDLPGFAREAVRVLRPGGLFALTTFFARVPDAVRVLPELLPPYADGLDVPHLVDDVAAAFGAAGLRDVAVTPIGDGVWECYDRYMEQRPELRDKWPRQYLTAYQTGLLDYYLITASAPAD